MLQKKIINHYKLNKINAIQLNFKIHIILRYNNLNSMNLIQLKKQLKTFHIYLYILKKNLINSKLLITQNSLLYLYTNEPNYLYLIFVLLKKYNLYLLFIHDKYLFSYLKIQKLPKINISIFFIFLLKKPILNLIFLLKKINLIKSEASIT